jgi:hypothetical protein
VGDDAATMPGNKWQGLLGFEQSMDLGQLSKCLAHDRRTFVWCTCGAAPSVEWELPPGWPDFGADTLSPKRPSFEWDC